ncbi:zinc finger protein 184-like [Discoglossus pictus]
MTMNKEKILKGTPTMIYQQSIQFDDVAVYFSKEEWDCLIAEEKELYREVMEENYRNLREIGLVDVKPAIISKMEQGEEPYARAAGGPVGITADESMARNSSEGRNISFNSVVKGFGIAQSYIIRKTLAKESKSSLDGHLTRSHVNNHRGATRTLNVDSHINTYSQGNPETLETRGIVSIMSPHCKKGRIHVDPQREKSFKIGEKRVPDFGKCSSASSQPDRHRRTCTGEKRYACKEYGKCFSQDTSRIAHMRSHRGEKPSLRSEDDKCFTNETTLLSPQVIHPSDKPFACTECVKSFSHNEELDAHQSVHMEQKMFICPECGRCYTPYSMLLTHQKSHTVKPFACSMCTKRFVFHSQLISHMDVHRRSVTEMDNYSKTLDFI